MTIEWMSFLIVFGASLSAACIVVGLYALGIRFLAIPGPAVPLEDGTYEPNGPSRDDEDDDVDEVGRPAWATAAANACFIGSAGCVLVGIYLIVPALHG